MKRLLLILLLATCPFLVVAERVALVIGCNRYANLPPSRQLTSPVHDAEDVAAALKSLGYTLVTGAAVTNAGKDTIISATERFAQQAKDAEAAVFYFSGHGVQMADDNYILPSDVPSLTGLSVLRNRSVLLRDSVMVALEEAGARTKVIILDCCRDNPFAVQLESALSQISKSVHTKSVGAIEGYGPGFYLAFATSPGFTAEDGNGQRNSPFTAALLKTLPSSGGKDIDFFFRDVKAFLGAEQVSWTNNSLTQEFSLGRPQGSTGTAAIVPTPSFSPVVTTLPPAPAPSVATAVVAPLPTPITPGMILAVGQPLPARGYFSLDELFSSSAYAGFNSYSRTQILRRAQVLLKAAGFYAGEADGTPGPNTHSALRSWQEQRGLAASGLLDQATLAAMNLMGLAEETPPVVSRPPAPRSVPADKPPASNSRKSQEDDFRDMVKRLNKL